MPEIPEPEVRVTRYEVSCLPHDHADKPTFTVLVENVGGDWWAVRHSTASLSADGVKSWGWRWEDGREPATPDEAAAAEAVHDEWVAAHRRFDEQTALRIAREYAPKIRIRDYTVADALADQDRQEGR